MKGAGFAAVAVGLGSIIDTGTASASPWNPPRPPEVVPPEQPFLKLPFKRHFSGQLTVTQGWLTEATEAFIIGSEPPHRSIDFEGYEYGRPILAAADGWAYYSYQRFIVDVDYKDPLTGRQIDYIDEGAGLFVEIIHDTRAGGVPGNPHWVTQYAHLAHVAPKIPFVASDKAAPTEVTITGGPSASIDNWFPSGINQPQDVLIKNGWRVRQGDVIGFHGDTGIGANWHDNWDPVRKVVRQRNRVAKPPWDPQGAYGAVPMKYAAQLHFNLYAGRGADGQQGQQNRIDPLDLYGGADLGILPGSTHVNPYTDNVKGGKPYAGPADSKTAFVRGRKGSLLYAG